MGVATDERAPAGIAPFALGATVFAGALVTGPLTGRSFNPAERPRPATAVVVPKDVPFGVEGPIPVKERNPIALRPQARCAARMLPSNGPPRIYTSWGVRPRDR
jgi:hypothetical protein